MFRNSGRLESFERDIQVSVLVRHTHVLPLVSGHKGSSLGAVIRKFFHHAAHRLPENQRSTTDYINSFGDANRCPPLVRLIGFHLSMICADFMHIAALGMCKLLVATVLSELCLCGQFGHTGVGRFKARIALQLRTAWFEFKDFAKQNGLNHSQLCFTSGMLSLKSMQDVPEFKGKAVNCMHIVVWLSLLELKGPVDDHTRLRGACLTAMAKVWELCHLKCLFFTNDQARAFFHHGRNFLLSYRTLNVQASLAGKRTWALRPKFHMFDHLCFRTLISKRNPGTHWAFSDESFIGDVKRLIPNMRPGRRKTSLRVLQRHYTGVRLRLANRIPSCKRALTYCTGFSKRRKIWN